MRYIGMQNPANLDVTAQARLVAIEVYRATRHFPVEERYGLTSQMRRAAVGIGSSIAEGCGRYGDHELARFCNVALGSASELEFQTQLSGDLGFLPPDVGTPLLNEISRAKKMLARPVKALRPDR
jgi:four helix bundle protein